MLQLDLYRVFEDKGIENPNRFLRKNGFTPHTASRLLNNNVQSISFKHLEQLCLLLNCSVEDLFDWKPEKQTEKNKDLVLHKLLRGQRKGNITTKLKTLPLEKLNDVRKYIDQITKDQQNT